MSRISILCVNPVIILLLVKSVVGESSALDMRVRLQFEKNSTHHIGFILGENGKSMKNVEAVESQMGTVRASNVLVFSSDTGSTVQAIGSNIRNGQLMYNDHGRDGETSGDAHLNAAYSAHYVLATGGSMEKQRRGCGSQCQRLG